MDPLTALSLASNVVQFVDFALGLIGTVSEITSSASGASKRTLELATVYERLQKFTATLSQPAQNAESADNTRPAKSQGVLAEYAESVDNTGPAESQSVSPGRLPFIVEVDYHVEAIKVLAGECKDVCDRLLALVNSLRLKPDQSGKAGRWVKATVLSLKTVFAEKKISELEQRLKRFQTMIGLHFLPLIEAKQSYLIRATDDIASRSISHSAILDEIRGLLANPSQGPGSRSSSSVSESSKGKGTAVTAGSISGSFGLRELEETFLRMNLAEKNIKAVIIDNFVVKSLHYSDRMNRYEGIHEAHAATFQWMFEDSAPREGISAASSRLLYQWLCCGSGTFWVTGKPGSGKSTFMKFVASHPRTKIALEKWADPKNVVIATHYFWNAGTTMQKSIRGLLQSLLYCVLKCQPDLASVIFSTQWHEIEENDSLGEKYWTIEEMKAGLHTLAQRTNISTKFCFFIDGLDEYDGKYTDEYGGLCQLLDEISSSPHLKCCVSSRPWNVFANAYAENTSSTLRIHEVTFQDIEGYCRSRLSTHRCWEMLDVSPDVSKNIISDITNRAEGVFMWVRLVTTSLRNGLTDGDTISDLRTRLDSLPTEIEPFYKHMLDLVEPINNRYLSRTLQFACNTEETSLLAFCARELEDDNSNYALAEPPRSEWTRYSPSLFLEPCRRRINSRCGGLLGIGNGRVEFIHRTARDFLATQRMHNYLRDKAGGGDYYTKMALLKIAAYLFRCFLASPAVEACERLVNEEYIGCFRFANDALDEDEEYGISLLSSFTDTPRDRVINDSSSVRGLFLRLMGQRENQKTPRSTTSTDGTLPENNLIGPHVYHHLFEHGLEKLIVPQLMKNPLLFRNMPVSPLAVPMKDTKHHMSYVRIKISLLKAGYDVNQPVGHSTAWHCFVCEYLSLEAGHKVSIINPVNGVSLMISYLDMGARRVQRFNHSHRCSADVLKRPLFPLTHILGGLFWDGGKWEEAADSFAKVIDAFLSGADLETTMQLEELISTLPSVLEARSISRPLFSNVSEFVPPLLAGMKVVIEKGYAFGVDMQRLVPVILALFEHSEREFLLSLIFNGPRRDVTHSSREEDLHAEQKQIFPTQVSVRAPKRQLQGHRGDAEDSSRRVKRPRSRNWRPNRNRNESDDSCIEVIEISD